MQSLRQLGAGILLGILSVLVVLGGFSLAMAEGGALPAGEAATPTASGPATIIVTIYPTLALPTLAPPPSATPAGTDTPGPTETASPTLTSAPTLANCQRPAGWLTVVVLPYDTLTGLSQVYRTSVDVLRAKNCLTSDELVAGTLLYVPPLPTSTFLPCGAPANWGRYTVVPGDTLYHISQLYRVTVAQLMLANCLTSSNIGAGQVLRVPNVATSTPAPSDTPFPTPTDTFTATASPIPATETPVPATEVPSPTFTATDIVVDTNTPAPTDTQVPPTATP